jgi:hypothetical protein
MSAEVFRIKRDVGCVDYRSVHPHRMAEPRLAGDHPGRMSQAAGHDVAIPQ